MMVKEQRGRMEKGEDIQQVRIVEYRSRYRRAFRDLNYEWLEKYFTVEPFDEILLGDPEGQIIRRGGSVLFAVIGEEVVGTCALLKHAEKKYELAKMGVSGTHQGKGIGRQLIAAAIQAARERGAETMVLATSPVLEAANKLYQSVGFREADESEIGPLPYQRHSIVMAMDLQSDQ
jgi:ribosomal protein S18 acetylase RimI-like enzyme